MKLFLVLATLLVSKCSGLLNGAVSSQYQHLAGHSYSYGYADPNSQKHESRSHDGVTRGSYSYLDGHGDVQSVSYTADPHHGFNAVGTNFPKSPVNHNTIYPYAVAHSYVPYHHAAALHHQPLTHLGVPIDTPEVQHARAAHLAAHAAAAHVTPHHTYKRSIYGYPWAAGSTSLIHGGVPVDTPEVLRAKAAHYAAHAAIRVGHPSLGAVHAVTHHVPVIQNGVPVDTPEVQHAKAAHFAALAEATARDGHGSDHYDGSFDGRYDGHWDGSASYANSIAHYAPTTGHYDGYKGPIHVPVIHNGVPVEPVEVQHARTAHLNALAAASHGSSYPEGFDRGHYNHN